MPNQPSPNSHPKPTQNPTNPMPAINSNQPNSITNGISNRVDVFNSNNGRILCIADLRGNISQINKLAEQFNATAVIHTGDFGFYEPSSLDRISDRTMRHLLQYSSLISPQFRSQLLAPSMNAHSIRQMLLSPPKPSSSTPAPNLSPSFALSEFPDLLSGKLKLNVPVYTIWGACEDVAIVEKIRAAGPSVIKTSTQPTKAPESNKLNSLSAYCIPNLTVIDEATTRCLDIGGLKLRLFGLGGAIVPHKLFDNGEGGATIAGGQGTMWAGILQVGELVDTAQRVYDQTETRLLISHASPGREGLLAQLALVLKTDLTISAGLHFRYGVSYNEFSVQHDQEIFRSKFIHAKSTFNEIWDTVKNQVDSVIDDHQRQLLSNALAVANRVPSPPHPEHTDEEPAWKNSWNWNLPDAAYGSLVLDINEGRIGSELRSQGFNFAYRSQARTKPPTTPTQVVRRAPPVHALNSSGNLPSNSTAPFATRPSTSIHSSHNHDPKPLSTNSSSGNAKNPFSHSQHSASPITLSAGGPTNQNPTRFQQQHGSRQGSQANSRHSNQYFNQPHRYSKSRDENRDDTPRAHIAPQSNSGSLGADSSSKPAPQARTKPGQDDQSKNSTSVNNRQESPTQSASPAPSRKASFVTNKKKKGSGGQTTGAKNELEQTNPEKTDVKAETGSGATKAAPGSVGSTKEPTGKTGKPEEGVAVTPELNEKTPNTKPISNIPSDSHRTNVVDGDSGSHNNNYYNNKGRSGPRGRGGGPGHYNMRINRGGGRGGGRGTDRDSFLNRSVGPGLVGAALADAGIGNSKTPINSTSNGVVASAATTADSK